MPTRTQVLSSEYIRTLQNMGYTFRMNQCTDQVEVNGEPITDPVEADIFTKLRDQGFPNVNVARDAFVAHAYHNRYHPIRDYINGLKYDGGKYIEKLCSYFGNPDGMLELWLTRWLIGAVRRAVEPGAQNRVLVIDGPQGIGKSKFAEWLTPPPLHRYFMASPIDPENKDHKVALMHTWIWEIGEFGSTTRKADRDALKFFISREFVEERRAYARYPTQKPALTSFIGTVNAGGGVLSDPTGDRRFMFSRVESIDWKGYTSAINVDDVWAEAQMLYYAGEPADLTPDEIKKAKEVNAEYIIENPIEGVLMKHFEVNPKEKRWWVSSKEIVETLEDPSQGAYRGTSGQVNTKLSELMVSLGCERKKLRSSGYSNPVWGYCGVRKKVP